jgi:molybdate transport system substrate-binding protein
VTLISRTLSGVLLGAIAVLTSSSTFAAESIRVAAGESFKIPLEGLAASFERSGGEKIVLNFAASSTLAKQVEAGGVDIVACAQSWSDYLAQHQLLQKDTRRDFLGDHLVLIAATGYRPFIELIPGAHLADTLNGKLLSLADPDKTQTGRYAQLALTNLGIWESVVPNLLRSDNVRTALMSVVRGEAAMAIVYRTDLQDQPQVHAISTFPDDTHPPIVYSFALTATASPAAKKFLALMESGNARTAYSMAGFVLLHAKQ